MTIKNTFLAIASYLVFISTVNAQAPKYSNEFLSIGVGARALGMGGVQTAIVNDATAGYWNPAGLVQKEGDVQLALMHAEYFAGIAKYDYAALAAPIDATSTIGFSFLRFAIDDIIDSTDLIDANGNIDYDRLKSFSAADYAFLFSYSKITLIEGLRYGGNVKVIHRKIGDFANAWGFGLDLGAQYDLNKWRFGAMGKDITSTFNAWTFNTESLEEAFGRTDNEIPQNGLELTLPKLILGIGYEAKIGERITAMPVMDLDITFDGKRNVLIKSDPVSIDPHFGIELGYADMIFLRAGAQNIQEVKDIDNSTSKTIQPNMGVGVKIKNITIDYALTNIGNSAQTLYSNIFSLKWNIYKDRK